MAPFSTTSRAFGWRGRLAAAFGALSLIAGGLTLAPFIGAKADALPPFIVDPLASDSRLTVSAKLDGFDKASPYDGAGPRAGDTVNYTVTGTNGMDEDLASFKLLGGWRSTPTCTPAIGTTLAAGASFTCQVSRPTEAYPEYFFQGRALEDDFLTDSFSFSGYSAARERTVASVSTDSIRTHLEWPSPAYPAGSRVDHGLTVSVALSGIDKEMPYRGDGPRNGDLMTLTTTGRNGTGSDLANFALLYEGLGSKLTCSPSLGSTLPAGASFSCTSKRRANDIYTPQTAVVAFGGTQSGAAVWSPEAHRFSQQIAPSAEVAWNVEALTPAFELTRVEPATAYEGPGPRPGDHAIVRVSATNATGETLQGFTLHTYNEAERTCTKDASSTWAPGEVASCELRLSVSEADALRGVGYFSASIYAYSADRDVILSGSQAQSLSYPVYPADYVAPIEPTATPSQDPAAPSPQAVEVKAGGSVALTAPVPDGASVAAWYVTKGSGPRQLVEDSAGTNPLYLANIDTAGKDWTYQVSYRQGSGVSDGGSATVRSTTAGIPDLPSRLMTDPAFSSFGMNNSVVLNAKGGDPATPVNVWQVRLADNKTWAPIPGSAGKSTLDVSYVSFEKLGAGYPFYIRPMQVVAGQAREGLPSEVWIVEADGPASGGEPSPAPSTEPSTEPSPTQSAQPGGKDPYGVTEATAIEVRPGSSLVLSAPGSGSSIVQWTVSKDGGGTWLPVPESEKKTQLYLARLDTGGETWIYGVHSIDTDTISTWALAKVTSTTDQWPDIRVPFFVDPQNAIVETHDDVVIAPPLTAQLGVPGTVNVWERSDDDGATWLPIPGSAGRASIDSGGLAVQGQSVRVRPLQVIDGRVIAGAWATVSVPGAEPTAEPTPSATPTATPSATSAPSTTPTPSASASTPAPSAKVSVVGRASLPKGAKVAQVGDRVEYLITIANTGDLAAKITGVTAPKLTALTCLSQLPFQLKPGAGVLCHANRTVTPADAEAGSMATKVSLATNPASTPAPTATITTKVASLHEASPTPSASASAPAEQARLMVLARATHQRGFDNGKLLDFATPGQTISYAVTVANTSTATANGVTVLGDGIDSLTCTLKAPFTVRPGQGVLCFGSHIVTLDEAKAGRVLASVTATATTPLAAPATVSVTTTEVGRVPDPDEPTIRPTAEPEPTTEPTSEPTSRPTSEPTAEPTSEPTVEPTQEPTMEPSAAPAHTIVFGPSLALSESATDDIRLTRTVELPEGSLLTEGQLVNVDYTLANYSRNPIEVSFSDSLPDGLTPDPGIQPGWQTTGRKSTSLTVQLQGGMMMTFVLRVRVDAGAAPAHLLGTYPEQLTGRSEAPEPTSQPTTEPTTQPTEAPHAQIVINRTASLPQGANLHRGEVFQVAYQVANRGNADARGHVVRAEIPAPFVPTHELATPWSEVPCADATDATCLEFAPIDVPAGALKVVSLTVRVPADAEPGRTEFGAIVVDEPTPSDSPVATLTPTASPSESPTNDPLPPDPDLPDPEARADVVVSARADLPDGASIQRGETVSMILTVKNLGPDTARNVHVSDVLPEYLTYDPPVQAGWTLTDRSATLTSPLTLAVNESKVFVLRIKVSEDWRASGPSQFLGHPIVASLPGEFPGCAGPTEDDPTEPAPDEEPTSGGPTADDVCLGCETAAPLVLNVPETQAGDIAVARTSSVPNQIVNPGDEVTLNYVLTNVGTSTARQVRVHDQLPAGLELVGPQPGWTLAGGSIETGEVTLEPGSRQVFELRARVAPSVPAGQILGGLAPASSGRSAATTGAEVSAANAIYAVDVTGQPGFELIGDSAATLASPTGGSAASPARIVGGAVLLAIGLGLVAVLWRRRRTEQ